MKGLFLVLIIVVGYGAAGRIQTQDPATPRLLDVLVNTGALSASDRDFLDRRRSNHSIQWAVPVTVEPDALNHSQLDVFLYDRHVRIIRGEDDSRAGNAWNGKVVLPGDPPGFDPGTMRDVRIVPLERGGIFATIRVDGFVYQVARLSSGTQVLSKQDLSKLHQSPNDILLPELRIEPETGIRKRNEISPDKIM